jgi:short-subunit dehydrogenase
VTICGRDEQTLKAALIKLGRENLHIDTISCDVTDENAISGLIRELHERRVNVDVLVNNAGRIEVGPLETATVEDFRKAMATHFWGPLNLMLAIIPEMQRRGEGRIVNISSIGGKIGVPHLIPYDASKFALAGLSESIAAEVRRHNIFVTTVYPVDANGQPAKRKLQMATSKRTFVVYPKRFHAHTDSRRSQGGTENRKCMSYWSSFANPHSCRQACSIRPCGHAKHVNQFACTGEPTAAKSGRNRNEHQKGIRSETVLTRSPLTALDRQAATDFNQIA